MLKLHNSVLFALLLIGMVLLAMMSIDSWTHSMLGLIAGYVLKEGFNNETLQHKPNKQCKQDI